MNNVGLGYDSHRLVKGRPLVLGGVKIPFEKGLLGHSDADVVLHAVIDALDRRGGNGRHRHVLSGFGSRVGKGADSLRLLEDVRKNDLSRRFVVRNVDVTLLAEAPRIGPYKNRMRAKIARVLRISVDRVNVKAKTNEGMGFVGRREGLAALAVCSPCGKEGS
jgi:2-C-methyl-D-erythritol 2,4-cyclodiphosphate synthase